MLQRTVSYAKQNVMTGIQPALNNHLSHRPLALMQRPHSSRTARTFASQTNSIVEQFQEGKYKYKAPSPFLLKSKQSIQNLECVFETYGKLNAKRNNAILIHHALSTSSHVASHPLNPAPGWWEKMVGPNKPIDTQQYYVVCINNLGSCFGTTGPTSINPITGLPYKNTFPDIHIEDMVNAHNLVLDALNISSCHAVIGASMGGMLSLSMAVNYPDRVKNLLLISSTAKSYPANVAFRKIQREIIQNDPEWKNGNYDNTAIKGFLIARKLGYMLYRNPAELNQRFSDSAPDSDISAYLGYNAKKFTSIFDANSYCRLTQAMDWFDISENGSFTNALKRITANVNIISVDTDILFPPEQQHEKYVAMRNANVNATYTSFSSNYGHDAFLVEIDGIGKLINSFTNKPKIHSSVDTNYNSYNRATNRAVQNKALFFNIKKQAPLNSDPTLALYSKRLNTLMR